MADKYLIEIGTSGLKRNGGLISEDFLPELRGQPGMRKYREMADNDDIVGSVMYAIEMLIRQVDFRVDPAKDSGKKGKEIADLVSGMFDDMSQPFQQILSDILTMLVYGFAPLEVVFKKRDGVDSKFSDGLLGWRKWALRGQDTISKWYFDDAGGIQALEQTALDSMSMKLIPIDRILLFRTTARKNNPEGRSLLRNAYRPYFFKRRMQELEAIGAERDLAGLPMLTPPEGLDIWNPNDADAVAIYTQAQNLVRSVRRDEQEGILKPFGWTFELLTTGSKRAFDTDKLITRYDQRIAMTMMADFVLIGHNAVGSKALAASKVRVFSMALDGILDAIVGVINRIAIPKLCEINGWNKELSPTLEHGDVDAPELAEIGEYISKLVGAGVPLFPNIDLERHLLKIARLPLPPEGMGVSDMNPAAEPLKMPDPLEPDDEPTPVETPVAKNPR